jgi:hypothetical protein
MDLVLLIRGRIQLEEEEDDDDDDAGRPRRPRQLSNYYFLFLIEFLMRNNIFSDGKFQKKSK